MNNKLLRQVQMLQLDILKEFVKICNNYHLQYFLDGGTLLGAVRHKGFIPWDDDLDVAMPRKDYDKFCKIASKSLPDDLFFQDFHTDVHYPNAYAKIRKKGTIFTELISQNCKMKNGIFIDIFPYDNYPEQRIKQIWQGSQIEFCKHILICKERVFPWLGMKKIKLILKVAEYFPFYFLAIFFKRDWIVNKYEKLLKLYNKKKCNYLKEPDLRYGKVIIPVDSFSRFINLEFEGEMFQCPEGYDKLLYSLYGDYMKLPPKNERGNWHHIKKIQI